ncbi:MAG TPA: mucoidy inhibitor MuiA family protein [Abditibacterium sp.]
MNAIDIETRISSVTIFTDRALVTRRGVVALQAGAQELLLGGLPRRLDVESLHASGRGVSARIIAVEARERTLPRTSNQSAREVQDELEKSQDEGRAIAERDAVWLSRLETLRQLSEKSASRYAAALSKGETDVEALTQLLDYLSAQQNEINAQRQLLEVQKRENAAQQMALMSRLKQLQNSKSTSERAVVVSIEAAEAGNWELELSYIVPGASWQPIYDARVQLTPTPAELTGRLSLTYGALLTQNSGEDWKNVAVTLSTARPGIGTLPPKMEPIFVDVERPMVAAAPIMARSRGGNWEKYDENVAGLLASLSPVEGIAEAPEPIEAEHYEAEVRSEGATVTFGLPRPLHVPSDGQPHRATIVNQELPVRFDYVAMPRRSSLAFLRAKATNASALSLLEGPVSVFRDDVFVGKARLEAAPAGGEITLFLGPDEAVRAEREMTGREVDKNFIGNARRTHFAYQIELHNLKNHPARLSVQDQIPVSRSEQIKVKLRGAQPEAAQSELGVLRWEITLAPGQKRAIRFDYGVETPREVRVLGLSD